MTQHDDGKPSQAEGEDPDEQPDVEVKPAKGHPSQAEGEDPDADPASKAQDPGEAPA